jgi:hypothetical protein
VARAAARATRCGGANPGTRNPICGNDEAQWPAGLNRVERKTGHERQARRLRTQRYALVTAVCNAHVRYGELKHASVLALHIQTITQMQAFKHPEMRVAVGRDDAVASVAGHDACGIMCGAKRQISSAGAFEHDE